MFLEYLCAIYRNVSYTEYIQQTPKWEVKRAEFLQAAWKLGKQTDFGSLEHGLQKGKPTYQNSRVKGIIKINKSSSEKLRLYTNEENRNVPEIWKVTRKSKQGRPKERLVNAWTSKSNLLQSQQKQPPWRLVRPRSDPHIRGTGKKVNAMAGKQNEAFYRVPRGGIWQYHCARAVLTGNISKDLPPSKKWIEEGEQQLLLMISSCSGKDEHPLPLYALNIEQKCQIKPKWINAK